jgi:ankyrin repeat protein
LILFLNYYLSLTSQATEEREQLTMSSSQGDTCNSEVPQSAHAEQRLRKAIQDDRNDEAIATMNAILREPQPKDITLCRWLNYSISCDNATVTEHLLGLGVDPDGDGPQTHLLFALKKNKFAIAQILLKAPIDLNATDRVGHTALMIAACKDQHQIVNTLLKMGADSNKRNRDGGNVLHYLAADKYCKWSRAIIDTLLTTNVEIDARDERGRTPLHWAVATGKTYLCECLLALPKERRANIQASDLRRKTSLHLAASKGHDDVIDVLLNHGADVHASADGSWKPIHVACEAGHKSTIQKLILAGAELNARLLTGMTPLHVAARAGHLDVIEFLLQQVPLEPLAKDTFGYTPFDYALRTKRKDIVAIMANVYNHLDDDAVGACQGYNATVTDFGNYFRGNKVRRLSTFELLYQLDDAVSEYKTKIYPKDMASVSFRWIHLPANNSSWVEQTLRRALLEEGNQDSSSFVAAARSLDHHYDGQYTHSRFMRSLCQETELRPAMNTKVDAPSSRTDRSVAATDTSKVEPGNQKPPDSLTSMTFLYMPYLHYESARRCQEMQTAIKRAELADATRKRTSPLKKGRLKSEATCDEMLLHAYNPPKTIFVRRTLNQFLHPNLATTARDTEQVASRYQEKLSRDAPHNVDHKIFMVDQLWMWVIGEKLVVTAFPQRWQQPRNDPLNVLESVIEDINARTRSAPVCTALDLAAAITRQCSTVFRSRSGFQEYQLLDVFDQSISDAVEMESVLFNEFNIASAQASAWLQPRRRRNGITHSAVEQHGRQVLFVDKLLEISAEINLMDELRHIRKELGIIVSIFEEQRSVLRSFASAIKRSSGKDQQVNVLRGQFGSIDQYIRDLERTDTKAERIYKSITDLLDLKQKHANALGVRFARDQAAELAGQRPTLIFTIVTIVFLPLSFVATLFTVNIRELPRQPGDSEPSLPLSFVLKYLLGIGFGISIPLIVVVLSFNFIKDVVREAKRRWTMFFSRKRNDSKLLEENFEMTELSLEHALDVESDSTRRRRGF